MKKFKIAIIVVLSIVVLAVFLTACNGGKGYTVSFNSMGGSPVADITVGRKDPITLPENPQKEGYDFVGWFLEENGSTEFSDSIPSDNITLYAKWIVKQYTIAFNSNGGSGVNPITDDYLTQVTAPPEPTRQGYTFAGWYTDNATFLNVYSFTEIPLEGIEVHAKWKIEVYDISYVLGGGINNEENPATYTVETQLITLQEPTRDYYTFNQWSEGVGIALGSTGDKTFTAVWTPVDYQINYILDGGYYEGSDNARTSYNIETDTYTLPIPHKAGHSFATWQDSSGEISKGSHGEKTFTATWTINSYILTFNTNGGSVLSDIEQVFNSDVTVPETNKDGYTFAAWYEDSGFGNLWNGKMPAGNKTLFARWTVNQYNVFFVENGGQDISDYSDTDFGTALPEVQRTGFTHSGWYRDDGTFEDELETVPAEDVTVYAKWTRNRYNITFNANSSDGVVWDSETINYVDQATYNLEYEEDLLDIAFRPGYEFAGWFDNSEGLGLELITVPAEDKTIYSKWNIILYHITFFDNEGSSPYGETGYDFTCESPEIPIPDAVRTGYIFSGWFSDAEFQVPAEVPLSANSYGDRDYYARWSPIEFEVRYYSNDELATGDMSEDYFYYDEESYLSINEYMKTGYHFAGWNTLENGTGTDFIDGQNITNYFSVDYSVLNLYAKWDEGSDGLDYDWYDEDEDSLCITGYDGEEDVVIIPGTAFFEDDYYSVVTINDYVFENTGVTGIYLPVSLETINSLAFYTSNWNGTLTSIEISADSPNFKTVDGVLFSKDGKTLISYPVVKDPSGYYDIPDGVENIGAFAFHSAKLEGLDLSGIQTIEEYALQNSRISSLSIPLSVINIEENAFMYCDYLGTVFCERTDYPTTWAEDLFSYYTAIWGTDGVERDYTFVYNNGESPYIISSVYYVASSPTAHKEGYHLYGWYDNEALEGEIVTFRYFSKTGKTTLYAGWEYGSDLGYREINEGTEYEVYLNHTSDSVINIPSSYEGLPVTKIATNLFNNNQDIHTVNLPSTLKYIGDQAFYAAGNIKSITLNEGLLEIGSWAFCHSGITSIALPGSIEIIGNSAFLWTMTIYCEAEEKPLGWHSNFDNTGDYERVVWGHDSVKRTYTLELNNGEDDVTYADVYGIDSQPEDPTYTDHTFIGWYDNEDFIGSAVTFPYFSKTGATTLYARWETI